MKLAQRIAGLFFLTLCTGCATASGLMGSSLNTPPEFDQQIYLLTDDTYEMYQAPRSGYDVGDLQSFHTQHTAPIQIEGAFKEIFGDVKMMSNEAQIETEIPDTAAIFEVHMVDLAHDIYNESTTYRSHLTLAVAMKTPRDTIVWQQSFRGEGYAEVDPQFSTGMGPEQAILDAMRDALDKMQKAIISNPQVRLQLQHYKEIDAARRKQEVKI